MSFLVAFGGGFGCMLLSATVTHVIEHYTGKKLAPIWFVSGALVLAVILYEVIK